MAIRIRNFWPRNRIKINEKQPKNGFWIEIFAARLLFRCQFVSGVLRFIFTNHFRWFVARSKNLGYNRVSDVCRSCFGFNLFLYRPYAIFAFDFFLFNCQMILSTLRVVEVNCIGTSNCETQWWCNSLYCHSNVPINV